MRFLMKNVLKVGIPVALTVAAYAAAKFKEQNIPSKEKPHSDAPIILALGDSITFGSGVAKTRATDTWEVKLEALFSGSYQVLNYGVSGATLQDEGNTPYWHLPSQGALSFPEAALALNPEIVLLMLGTNDSKPYNWNNDRYAAQLDMRVKEILQSKPSTRLILMCPPFACPADGSDIVGYDIQAETIRDEIVPTIKMCAEENQIGCIDLYTLTDNHPEYFADGVHPNSFGNRVIASYIHDYLTDF